MSNKRKIGAKRLYHHAWPSWEFEEHLSWRADKNSGHGTNKAKIHRIYSKKVRRVLQRNLHNELKLVIQ